MARRPFFTAVPPFAYSAHTTCGGTKGAPWRRRFLCKRKWQTGNFSSKEKVECPEFHSEQFFPLQEKFRLELRLKIMLELITSKRQKARLN